MIFISLLSLAFSAQRVAFFDLSGNVNPEMRKQLETSTQMGILSAVGESMDVLNSEQLYLTNKELLDPDCLTEGCELSIAKRVGADFYITGRISKIDMGYGLALNLYETSSAKLLGSAQAWGETPSEILKQSRTVPIELFEQIKGSSFRSVFFEPKTAKIEKGGRFGLPDVYGDRAYLFLHQDLDVFQYELSEGELCKLKQADSCKDDYPAQALSFVEVAGLANRLSEQSGLSPCYRIESYLVEWSGFSCTGWRLPTELEWEYLAMGGADFPYAGSGNVDTVASYLGNSGGHLQSMGSKKSNGFNLYDMSGSVWEWVWPEGVTQAKEGIARGGSFADSAAIASRKTYSIQEGFQGSGARFVRASK